MCWERRGEWTSLNAKRCPIYVISVYGFWRYCWSGETKVLTVIYECTFDFWFDCERCKIWCCGYSLSGPDLILMSLINRYMVLLPPNFFESLAQMNVHFFISLFTSKFDLLYSHFCTRAWVNFWPWQFICYTSNSGRKRYGTLLMLGHHHHHHHCWFGEFAQILRSYYEPHEIPTMFPF